MIYADAHCDALYFSFHSSGGVPRRGEVVDPLILADAGCKTQVFAMFADPGPLEQRRKALQGQLELFHAWQKNQCLKMILAAEDISPWPISSMETLVENGLRIASLTWNHDNLLAGGAFGCNCGLTRYGREVLKLFNEHGVILDLSHASPQTFKEALDAFHGKICVSHAGVAAMKPHPRNLAPWQIKSIIERKGFIGVPLVCEFLTDNREIGIEAWCSHVISIQENVGLGSDFYGTTDLPPGIAGPKDVHKLFAALQKRGLSPAQVNDVAFNNLENFLLS
ncbi:MAG: membrane dipeptidase [Clostridia bacterium]|nr:membrane dipeptidase [Clostridia bacterium]